MPSSYRNTVVGLLAKPQNEPAVARTLKLGIATKQMKAITQEKFWIICEILLGRLVMKLKKLTQIRQMGHILVALMVWLSIQR